MNARGRLGAALVMAGLLAATLAGTAQARFVSVDPFNVQFSEPACDDRYVIDGKVRGLDKIDAATAELDYQFFYFRQTYDFRTTVRNPDNGKWFTEHQSGTFSERDAVRLHEYDPDFVYAYETVDVGTYSVRDSRGQVVYTDDYRVVTSYVFDSLGDSQVGGEYLEEPVELVNTFDPDFDFCAVADDLLQ
jgi:hypothetical protein